jgi:hypothetical protein
VNQIHAVGENASCVFIGKYLFVVFFIRMKGRDYEILVVHGGAIYVGDSNRVQ